MPSIELLAMARMTDLHELSAAAREIKSAQDHVCQIEPFTSRRSDLDLNAGYEVAHLIHAARLTEGAAPVDRKIGFTNPAVQSLYGVGEPIWGYIYDTTVARLGKDIIATLEHFSLSLSCNGTVRETGVGANALGSPLTFHWPQCRL